ncbi:MULTISPECIES: lytic polysaccharide monooxygenase [Actinoalloteichus]|uniref:Chitin binding domain n=1 Tax=Actinoalloteichus fjordicus TaxID=1612552 RepID=A0AAC9PT22_9PSEU|nr:MULTISPECIES: lytic polysaccharide monooxygenase auxiliary activity family 9 protein [Actinoalloteichus]APU15635.1 Chitin binding domain [Actinoalloteichus fjordicus]APU21695.1 Chitin binding domain [Actinoalloteichus sp. GBA129-24]
MSSLTRARNPLAARAVAIASAVLLLLAGVFTGTSSAHGSVIDPPSRNFGCHDRWGTDHLNPDMATEDPMCWQAWQDNPNAMWNWNGLYRENVGGNHQAAIPDGQLCSGGRAEGGRYNSMDAVGDWAAADISNDFSVHLYDQASHGADYFQVYVTRQGFDPLTESLGWGDLELVEETGSYPPATDITFDVSAPGRTGRHIVYTIWQASHMDQSYYICSDVRFTG